MSFTEFAEPSRWVAILRVSTDAWLGMIDDRLYMGTILGPKREVDESRPIGLLPCLERRYDDVITELRAREIELLLQPGSLVARTPLKAIPRVALESRLDYWIQLALDWITDTPIDAVDHEMLSALARAPWASQRARHRAHALTRRG